MKYYSQTVKSIRKGNFKTAGKKCQVNLREFLLRRTADLPAGTLQAKKECNNKVFQLLKEITVNSENYTQKS
jgi:hypothetical protein